MDTIEAAFDHDRALVFGIGGSGDVVGAVPTARLLEAHGVETTLGGVAWKPAPADPQVGPRSLEEVVGAERVAETVAYATGDTRTEDGVVFAESRVAGHYGERVALLDVTRGLDGLVDGLAAACEAEGFDLVVGTDSGGDVLAAGDEPGLRSPVTDGLGLAALAALPVETLLGVFGWGSDGELTAAELSAGFERAARRDGYLGAWGLTPRVVAELSGVLQEVETEASRLPVGAAGGDLGRHAIRGGEVEVSMTPASTATFYFDPAAVAATSEVAAAVREGRTLDRVRALLGEMGLTTEFDRERERLAAMDDGG